jgi:hypothetical protein
VKRADGAVMTGGEMAEMIDRQAATIRRLNIENDNLHERVRKLTDRIERYERAFVEVVLPSELPEGAGE